MGLSTKKIVKLLPCKLTEMEKLEKFIELGDLTKKNKILITDLLDTQERLKALKKSIGGLDREIAILGDMAETGVEHRQVECEKTINDKNNMMTLVRNDTGEVVEERQLSEEELQVEMFDD